MAKVLVLGNGAREHALAWKLAQSDLVDTVFINPGNGAPFPKPKGKLQHFFGGGVGGGAVQYR